MKARTAESKALMLGLNKPLISKEMSTKRDDALRNGEYSQWKLEQKKIDQKIAVMNSKDAAVSAAGSGDGAAKERREKAKIDMELKVKYELKQAQDEAETNEATAEAQKLQRLAAEAKASGDPKAAARAEALALTATMRADTVRARAEAVRVKREAAFVAPLWHLYGGLAKPAGSDSAHESASLVERRGSGSSNTAGADAAEASATGANGGSPDEKAQANFDKAQSERAEYQANNRTIARSRKG